MSDDCAIWKFRLALKDEQVIDMPIDAEVLTAQAQMEQICLWVKVYPCPLGSTMRTFVIKGTGHEFPAEEAKHLKYIGTVQTSAGTFVWHVFEKEKP